MRPSRRIPRLAPTRDASRPTLRAHAPLPPLARGTLIQRYKRFLADVRLDDGRLVTATCPNTGSMLGLTAPGSVVWLSESDSPTRKYRFTWELVEADLGKGPDAGRHQHRPSQQAGGRGDRERRVKALAGYPGLRREVKYGRNSRIDLLLECADKGLCYVEIKNVHLSRRHGLAEFPDSVTARGAKHLAEMSDMVRAGHRAVMVFLIQRGEPGAWRLPATSIPATAGFRRGNGGRAWRRSRCAAK